MPITQDRMLALVSAAQDYERAWIKARHGFAGIADRLARGQITLEQAWPELDFMFNSSLFLSDPEGTLKTVAAESAHFKAVAKRNIKSAQWQREKREGRPPKVQVKRAPTKSQPVVKISNSPDPDANISEQELGLETAGEDLEPKPPQLDDAAKASIDKFLSDQLAKEQYEAEYGDKLDQSK